MFEEGSLIMELREFHDRPDLAAQSASLRIERDIGYPITYLRRRWPIRQSDFVIDGLTLITKSFFNQM